MPWQVRLNGGVWSDIQSSYTAAALPKAILSQPCVEATCAQLYPDNATRLIALGRGALAQRTGMLTL
jgi:hypothetical protein